MIAYFSVPKLNSFLKILTHTDYRVPNLYFILLKYVY